MTTLPARLTVPAVLPLVKAYYAKPGNGAGGSLHLVLDNKNIRDSDLHYCMQLAAIANDTDGVHLAQVLLQMTKTQRLKLASLV